MLVQLVGAMDNQLPKGLPHLHFWTLVEVVMGAEPPRVTLVGLGPQAQRGRSWPPAKEALGLLRWLLPQPWLAALVPHLHSWPIVELVVVGAEPPWVILGPEA